MGSLSSLNELQISFPFTTASNRSTSPSLVRCFGQRAHLYRIVCDEGGLYEMRLALLTKDLINDLALAHRGIYMHMHIFRRLIKCFSSIPLMSTPVKCSIAPNMV